MLEWLTSYKLADYAPVLEGNGYDTTELMIGITHEELQEMGITKIGHRKKLISALTAWPQDDHFLQVKPVCYQRLAEAAATHVLFPSGECFSVAECVEYFAVRGDPDRSRVR